MATKDEKTDIKKILEILDGNDVLADKVEKHDEWINGNGKVGAKTQLGVIQDKLKRIELINGGIIIALIVDIVVGFFSS